MQAYNPYLPLTEYIPDGEPHVFGGRVYIYGSHDRPHGKAYCEDHYNVWSADIRELRDWRNEGTVYYRTQDPSNADDSMQLWAPDATRGPDGRYYLYYCLSFHPEIGVAVSDSPAGPFAFYGHVKYPPSLYGGKTLAEHMPFDPAVLTDDDGRVYLYYGFAPAEEKEFSLPKLSEEELQALPPDARKKLKALASLQFSEYSMAAELEPDMLTLKYEPRKLIPGGHHTAGTGFEGHGFFEASSIRKFNGRYYFIYSSHKSHELCYAVSDKPVSGYRYGGTILSNGDIGYHGRSAPVYPLGNNHGSIEKLGDDFYVFYHRQTNGTEFSRQGCAEKLRMNPDGSIEQAEITSCGLNGGPLRDSGAYPAAIACHLADPATSCSIDYSDPASQQRLRITQEGYDTFIANAGNGAVIGYKYFDFSGRRQILGLELRGGFEGSIRIAHDPDGESVVGCLSLSAASPAWSIFQTPIEPRKGVAPLYILLGGSGMLDFRSFHLI